MTKSGPASPGVPSHTRRYLPALDGLRALAVGAVIAYHLGLPWARGGYLGVDFFFVVSGFLITGIIFREYSESGGVDLGNFYARRARRLLPALFVVIGAVIAFAMLNPGAPGTAGLAGDVGSALGYVANWRFVLSGQSYFDRFTVASPLRHTWSLAIEEQYYIIWPVLLMGILRITRRSRRWAVVAVGALAAASALSMALLYLPGGDPSRAYYGTDTRAFELLIGSGLALLLAGPRSLAPWLRRTLQVSGLVALMALVVAFFWISDTSAWMYRGGFLGVSLLGGVVVASATSDEPGLLGAMFSFGPLPWVGRLSYGLYLWHWPVIDLLTHDQTGIGGRPLMFLQVGVTVGAAVVSYYVIERPIRSGAFSGWRAWALAPSTAAILAGAVIVGSLAPPGAAFALGAPPPSPAASSVARAVAVAPPGTAAQAGPNRGFRSPSDRFLGDAPDPGQPSAPAPATTVGLGAADIASTLLGLGRHRTPTPQDPLRVLIVGDSVMYDASLGIQAALQATGVVQVIPHAVFGFGLTQKAYDWRQKWPSLVQANNPDVVLTMFGGWDASMAFDHGDAWYAELVDNALAVLQSGGASVVFLEYPQNHPPEIPGRVLADKSANEFGRQLINRVFAQESEAHPATVGFLPTSSVLESDGLLAVFLPGADGQPERIRKRDNVHICPAGSERLGSVVLTALTPPLALPAPASGWQGGPWRLDPRYDNPHGTCRP